MATPGNCQTVFATLDVKYYASYEWCDLLNEQLISTIPTCV